MENIPTTCPHCGGPLTNSADARTLTCLQCGFSIPLRPSIPFSDELVAAAEVYVQQIIRLTEGKHTDLREAVLWLLEEEWRTLCRNGAITLKVGSNPYTEAATCGICRKQLGANDACFRVEVRDRWRCSMSHQHLCMAHITEHFWEGDMCTFVNESLRLGPS